MERERLDVGVLIVGAGPAGLATALRLAQLFERHNAEIDAGTRQGEKFSTEEICVLEKGKEIGAHLLSGAVLDPRGLRELLPDFDKAESPDRAPLASPVKHDAVYYLTESGQWKFPILPPFFQNHGNYIVSLNRLGRWLGQKVESAGATVFTGFSGKELLYEGGKVVGVRTDDKGLDKAGKPKSNHEPGYDVRAKVTVLAEGPRGSLTKQLLTKLPKNDERNPQTYAIGVKELWEVPGRIEAGTVIHTAGWPLASDHFGGGFLYAMPEGMISLGLVAGLDYHDPTFDPQVALQRYKTHPLLRKILEGGKLIKYGAKTIPEGGWFSMPPLAADGALLVGDSAGFLNSQRLKGIHLAIKSGMLAAETIFDALERDDLSLATLSDYARRVENSWAREELWKVRNYHQAMEQGMIAGAFHVGLQMITGGRGLHQRYPGRAGHESLRKRSNGRAAVPTAIVAFDGKLTFDKLTDVYHSATKHEEDQPCHLLISDTNVCNDRCAKEYGNPCQYFCPAAVYEMVESGGGKKIHLNPSNCVHCKTCDIMDPYQIITWVPPEGGGGPSYENL
jgi:electron-transferring-flavoprotein dehydrogenase